MPKVVMFCTPYCPYCIRAKMLLDSKGVEFTELRVDKDPALRSEMEQRSGRTSVPQIFIDDFHVGGCDDLHALEAAGKLDGYLFVTKDAV
ncbi:MAG: glutaredoxin 3 [Gammaproteobacteria bacterium]|nr:glutaredoxin 3 [Gammaproteobacteria bacterium]MDH5653521.1 glutaredoxin 3 [Gammaproteobacteria bacterium]